VEKLTQTRSLALDLCPLEHFLIAEPFLLEAGADPCTQNSRVERFAEIVLGPKLNAARDTVDIICCGDHHDGYLAQSGIGLNRGKGLNAIQLGHYEVEQNGLPDHWQGRGRASALGTRRAQGCQGSWDPASRFRTVLQWNPRRNGCARDESDTLLQSRLPLSRLLACHAVPARKLLKLVCR
jgi:hypothetical protein